MDSGRGAGGSTGAQPHDIEPIKVPDDGNTVFSAVAVIAQRAGIELGLPAPQGPDNTPGRRLRHFAFQWLREEIPVPDAHPANYLTAVTRIQDTLNSSRPRILTELMSNLLYPPPVGERPNIADEAPRFTGQHWRTTIAGRLNATGARPAMINRLADHADQVGDNLHED